MLFWEWILEIVVYSGGIDERLYSVFFFFFFAQQGAQPFSLEVVCIFVCVFRAEGVCPPWPLPHLYRHPSVYWLMKNSWVCVWEQRNNFQYLARLWIQMMLNFGVLRWRTWRCLGAYVCSWYCGRLRSAGLMRVHTHALSDTYDWTGGAGQSRFKANYN